MSDATFTLEAHGADRVVNDIKKVNKATNKLNKTNMRGGMAVLEFSRGMEDFAMAGMRGAMNNIPGLLQSLGVGMGLTGVVTVGVVAVWKLTEAFEGWMNKSREAKNAAFAVGYSFLNIESTAKGMSTQINNSTKEMDALFQGMADADALMSKRRGLDDGVGTSKRKLDEMRELVQLTMKGATESEKELAKIRRGADAEAATAASAQKTVEARRESIRLLEAMRKGQQQEIKDLDVKGRVELINREATLAGTKAENAALARGVEANKAAEIGSSMSAKYSRSNKMYLFAEEGGFANAVKSNEVAKSHLENLNEQLNTMQLQLTQEKDIALAAERKYAAKEEEVELQEVLYDLAKKQKKEEEAKKDAEAAMKAKMAERAVSTDQMLSSQARSGLAGNEVRAAMDVLNIAKQSLKVMKQIARNTGKFNKTYA
jgi:hypothetical protein